MKTLTLRQVIQNLEVQAPTVASEPWDNTGLILGHPDWKTPGAIISDDLTADALKLALDSKAKLMVLHHPPIFKGISKLVARSQFPDDLSTLMVEALQNGIGIAAYHTNFDRCALEVVHDLAKLLECTPKGRLFQKDENWQKLVVFVPQTHAEEVRAAICEAGAGMIGNYDQCAFMTSGTGTFRGLAGSNPTLGKPGLLEQAQEQRIETILPKSLKAQVLKKLFEVHPYEEVAFDVYDLDRDPPQKGLTAGIGYGFWGEYEKPISFEIFSQRVKKAFGLESWLETANLVREIKRVAFSPGKGSSFVDSALHAKADVYVTGEVGYHAALDGSRKGLKLIELGHRESEKFFLNTMSRWINQMGIQAEVSSLATQFFTRI